MTIMKAFKSKSFLFCLMVLVCSSFLALPSARSFEFGTENALFELTGFLGVGTAVRLADVEDLNIGFETIERGALVAQLNKARLSLYGMYPHDISSQLTVDLEYASEPNQPFNEKGEVRLDEAYVDFWYKDFDIRFGLQKVIWGKADLISPFDVLTARDLKDPFVWPTLEDRIAQAGIRVNYNWQDYTIEGVFFPVWIRSRVPQAETEDPQFGHTTKGDQWFPPMAVYQAEAFLVDDPSGYVNWLLFIPTYYPMEKPDKNLKTMTFGLKANRLLGNYDIDFYLLTAMDPTPTATIKTTLEDKYLPDYDWGLEIEIEGNMQFKRTTTVGTAVARTLGPVGLRTEMAVVSGKQYFRLFDPEDADEAIIEWYETGKGEVRGEPRSHSEFVWITGVDYEIPRFYILTSSQFAVTKRFQHEDYYTQADSDVDWTFRLKRSFFDDYLDISLTGMAGLRAKTLWISPAANYTLPMYEDVELGARFSAFSGDEFSKIGMYGEQSSLILSARWLF
jgi:hypothetical protein